LNLSGSSLMKEYNDYKKDKHTSHVIMHDMANPRTAKAMLSAASISSSQRQAERPPFPGMSRDSTETTPPSEISKGFEGIREELKAVLLELRFMTKKIRDDERTEDDVEEWQFAAKVIDRLCFWVCTLALSIGTVAIFLMIPDEYTGPGHG